MKNGIPVLFAVFLALGASWVGFVLAPAIQLGAAQQTAVLNSADLYPSLRTGDATMGLQAYRANGCAACHTEQIRQDGVVCDVVVTDAGKKPLAVTNLLATLNLLNLTKAEADVVAEKISTAGGKSETHIVPLGADLDHGWGVRRSVAEDFLYDYPVQIGTTRVGPDLANIGARSPDANWLMLHLYEPRSVVPKSLMPSFHYLFEVKVIKPGTPPSPDALNLPPAFAPPAGSEVVPKPEARQLVAYLLSLRANVPVYDAPFTPPAKP
jgi:cbb3-type cytochrome oxidase cytochrome c subunit